ncbi:ATP-dependent Clp protease ATP-binding subunit, partial [Amycolatopsis sp. H6(2020)]|nr:ATP-dependent Clp protease ATP-binding subunit [Amycolatopsis sp. H6(2020)]
GRLTDSQGRVVDFKNTVIIMTTNLGTRDISRRVPVGFQSADDATTNYERMQAKVQEELKEHFRPEFLNRVDDIIVFPQLTEKEIIQIVDLFVARLAERLRDQDMSIELTDAAKRLLAERGYDPAMGARPLRRTMQRMIEDQLSEKILFGEISAGEKITVDVEGEGQDAQFTFSSQKMAELSEDGISYGDEGVEITDSHVDPEQLSGSALPPKTDRGGGEAGPASGAAQA